MKKFLSFWFVGMTTLFVDAQGKSENAVCLGAEDCRTTVLNTCMNEKCVDLMGKALNACLEANQCTESTMANNYDYIDCAKKAGCYPQEPGTSTDAPTFPFPPQHATPGDTPGTPTSGKSGGESIGISGGKPGSTSHGGPARVPGGIPGKGPVKAPEEPEEEFIDTADEAGDF